MTETTRCTTPTHPRLSGNLSEDDIKAIDEAVQQTIKDALMGPSSYNYDMLVEITHHRAEMAYRSGFRDELISIVIRQFGG